MDNKKTITIDQALRLNDAVDTLFEQNMKYQINVGYRLYQLKNELNDITNYVVNRVIEVIPKIKEENVELSENEQLLYQTILSSPIDIDTFGLTRAEIYLTNESVTLDKPSVELQLIENLEPLF